MPKGLIEVLQRCDLDPPVFLEDEWELWPDCEREWLLASGVVRPGPPLRELPCDECGELHDVLFVADRRGNSHAYLRCPDGPTEVAANRLRRWHINVPALVDQVCQSVRRSLPLTEVIPDSLWNVGVGTWSQSRWSIFFGRCFHDRNVRSRIRQFRFPPKSVVFTPSSILEDQVAGLPVVIPLVNVVSRHGGAVQLDHDYVEAQLGQLAPAKPSKVDRPIRKRAARTATIELLTKALMEHIRAARDHAFATLDHQGAAELLPRPSQRELARLAEVSEVTVSRCLRDSAARELQFLWSLANDLPRLMEYRTKVAG